MKMRNLVLVGGMLILTYKTGELMGLIAGKRELSKKQNPDICDDGKMIEVTFKRLKITIYDSVVKNNVEGEAQ